MSMSATKDLNSRRYAVRPVVMMTACIAALLLAVPLFTLEADARGGGGGGGRCSDRLGPHGRGARNAHRPPGPRRIRQPRHRQCGLAIAIRVIALSRQVLRLALVAVVARRHRHRLGRTSVLALRLLRFLRLRVLAVRL